VRGNYRTELPRHAWEYEYCMYVLRATRGYSTYTHVDTRSSACIGDIAQGRESVFETARARYSR
jgi:hypothetical protein